jgi:L-ascorbate metabolism protein UlaG (beta-lactamase superfamily)
MKRRDLFCILFLLIFIISASVSAGEKEAEEVAENIHWLGHDTFKITGEKVIYTDPFEIKQKDTADIILITHEHRDHCSTADLEKVRGPKTVIVATPDCASKLSGDIRFMKPGDRITVEGVDIEAVPAYNTNKKFHPKGNAWIGYIFTVNGMRIYLAGDTDHIPEMKNFNVDIALLPVSGTYVMTAEEAVKAAIDINPKVAIPMHYDSVVGTLDDAERFAAGLKGRVEVKILKEE